MTTLRTSVVWVSPLAIAFLLLAQSVSAQSIESLKVTPAMIQDNAAPAAIYTYAVSITNQSDRENTYYLGVQDITGVDDNGTPIFAEESQPSDYALSSWVRLPTGSVTLKAGESRNIPFTVQVPNRPSPGAHFGAIFFDLRPPTERQNSASIGYRVGMVLSLKIAGTAVEEAQLREFSTDKMVYSSPHVIFNSKVENLGNVLLQPHGIIEVIDTWGKVVATVRVNDAGGQVFPNAARTFKAHFDSDSFAFGRYQATLSLVYGTDGRKTISRVTSFWILPIGPILLTLAVVFGGIFGLFLFVRMYIRRRLREMGVLNSRNADPIFQMARYSKPVSRLTTVFFAVMVFCVIFLLLILYILA